MFCHRGLRRSRTVLLICVSIATHWTSAVNARELVRELGQIKFKELDEISGMAASRQNPDVLWLHNDGDTRLVFAISTSGDSLTHVRLPIAIVDAEDIALGPGPKTGVDYLYLGDIGDNDERRRDIRVLRFAEPWLPTAPSARIEVEAVETFRLTYPDGRHNAEALFVDPVTGDLFIVTKEKRNARLFTCSAGRLKENAVVALELVTTLDVGEVSGGAIAADGSRIILRREDQGWLWNRRSDQNVAAALRGTPAMIVVRGPRQGRNGESVTFRADGRRYYTVSEGKKQVICEFELPPAVSASSRQ